MITALLPLLIPQSGALMLAGGGSTTKEMVARFERLCGGKDATIVVLGQTRQTPSNATSSAEMLKKHGFAKVQLVDSSSFSPTDLKNLETQLAQARGVWIPGGDQNLFMQRLGTDWCRNTFPKLIKNGLNWFGTSAGAMVVSDPMISKSDADGNAILTPGIGLADALVDTHYRARKRENRLRNAFFKQKHEVAIGLDEEEWIILRDGVIEDKHGEPHVIVREQMFR